VVSARCGTRAARSKRVGTAFVGTEAPAGRRRLVDGSADEWVPETESPRHVGFAYEVEPYELVDRPHRFGFRRCGGGCCELGLERVTRDSGALEHQARLARQQGELFTE
jgi:hypothetical protein